MSEDRLSATALSIDVEITKIERRKNSVSQDVDYGITVEYLAGDGKMLTFVMYIDNLPIGLHVGDVYTMKLDMES